MSAPIPFAECLLSVAADRAEQPAVRHRGKLLSYSELFRHARGVGGALRSRGLASGDRVLLVCDEKLPLLMCHLGTLLAGGVSVPLNPKFTPDELSYFLSDSGARFAVASRGPADVLERLIAQRSRTKNVRAECEVIDPHALLEANHPPSPEPTLSAADDALMLYTSGTTGHPKGAVHPHGNLMAAVRALADWWQFTPDDVLLHALPLYHIHGLSFACHVAFLSGCQMILSDRFHPRHTLEEIGKATVFYGIPTFYYAFMERPEFRECARRWKRLRLATCGSAPIRPEVLPDLEAILGRPLINRYGMTETHVITSLPLNGPAKQGSVGLPLSGIELVVRKNDGQPARPGEVGPIWVRGPNLFDRYWQMPVATQEAFDAQRWFATGDLGETDSEGFLTLRGREKDLIIVSGHNVYPPVVERVLNACPGVRESAVVGVPDRRKGERVVAAVVKGNPQLDESILRAYCRERLVAYRRPSRIVFVEALPRNTMGKVLKRELRESIG